MPKTTKRNSDSSFTASGFTLKFNHGMNDFIQYLHKFEWRLNVRNGRSYQLGNEYWMDVFSCITRPELCQLAETIGNYWFGEKLQAFLHEWGKRTMKTLAFNKNGITSTERRGRRIVKNSLEFPQTEVPENFKFFSRLLIRYFDERVLNFFQLIKPMLAANNVSLSFHYNGKDKLPVVRQIFGHLLPLIDGIRSVHPTQHMLPSLKPMFRGKFAQIRQLHVYYGRNDQKAIGPTIEWLTMNNGEPKFLHVVTLPEYAQLILEAIRTQFLNSKEPATFAVLFKVHRSDKLSLPICENGIGEQLYGRQIGDKEFEVLRHPANAGDELRKWLDENVDKNSENSEKNQITIWINKPKLGAFYAIADDVKNADDDQQQPCSSTKKRAIARKKKEKVPEDIEDDDPDKPCSSKKRRIGK